MYLSVHSTHFYGGTAGCSYRDVLTAGGVEDVAAAAGFTGWPDFSAEEILRLDPPLLVMPGCFWLWKRCAMRRARVHR